mmetsp:Transcript_14038/g.25392  ORF Transcript_14038/g.25392 Transcript_14038/m.25392 type:complete len:80 (-) Transcript_14038:612-851(-)
MQTQKKKLMCQSSIVLQAMPKYFERCACDYDPSNFLFSVSDCTRVFSYFANTSKGWRFVASRGIAQESEKYADGIQICK